MSRKTNRLRQRLRIAEERGDTNKLAWQRRILALEAALAASQKDLARARQRLDGVGQLDAFRISLSQVRPFGRGELYSLAITFDAMRIRDAFRYSHRPGDPFNLSNDLHYLVDELAYKVREEISKQLVKDGVMV